MKPMLPDRDKLDAAAGPVDAGYVEWKRAKIQKGLAQRDDRAAMISFEQRRTN